MLMRRSLKYITTFTMAAKVDWAAHANDPVGMATDMLAYDRACGAALEFARQNGETAVIMVPDHGNSDGHQGMQQHRSH